MRRQIFQAFAQRVVFAARQNYTNTETDSFLISFISNLLVL